MTILAILTIKATFGSNPEKTASPFALQATISSRPMSNHGLRHWHLPRRRPEIYFVRRPVAQRLMQPLFIVELKIGRKAGPDFGDRPVFAKINLLVFHGLPESFDKDVVVHPARPSMLIPMPSLSKRVVNSSLVYCGPWSVLKIPGLEIRSARSSAST